MVLKYGDVRSIAEHRPIGALKRHILVIVQNSDLVRFHWHPSRDDLIRALAVADHSSTRWDGGARNDSTNPVQNKPALSCTLARATSKVFRASLNNLIFPFSATSLEKKS